MNVFLNLLLLNFSASLVMLCYPIFSYKKDLTVNHGKAMME